MKIKDISYGHQQAIMMMLPQLLIVLINRLGGDITIPATEIDGTGKYNLAMSLDPMTREFHFVVQDKAAAPAKEEGK